MSSNRGHRAGQCAPEVPRTRIRARGDLQEGHGCASRCQFLLFLCRSPFFPSTKSAFLCAFCLRTPRVREFRAQNRGFCALLPSETPVFGRFEHKIEVFVRYLPSAPPLSGLCEHKNGIFVRFEISMIQDVDPRDNVIAERVNGILLD